MTIVYYLIDNFWPLTFMLTMILAPIGLVMSEISVSRENKLKELETLKFYVMEEYNQYRQHHDYSENKTLRKFFSDKDIYNRAKELSIENEWIYEYYSPTCSEDDLREKRKYSYNYENLVYEIFDEWGYRLRDDEWLIHKELSNHSVVCEIARKQRITLCDAIKLFDEFIQNGLLQYGKSKGCCIMGYTLHNWDCISKDDNSYSKWKNEHRPTWRPSSTLKEFYLAFGKYELYNKEGKWLMEYNRNSREMIQVFVDDDFTIREIEKDNHDWVDRYSFGKDISEEKREKINHFLSKYEDCLFISYNVYNYLTLKININKLKLRLRGTP